MSFGGKNRFALISGLAVAVMVAPFAVQAAGEGAPIARYDMRAGTVSGMAGMGAGMGSAMSMMFGGGRGGNVQHELYLRIGSSNGATKGNPKADHFMPPNAKLGKSVALTTPREEKAPDILPEKPKGRLLIFWGCGEHAPKGQPIVLDFAKVAAGQIPAGMPTSAVVRDWGPTLSNSKTFGRWPSEDGKYVKADSSLPGPHKIVSNYAPEINFTLTKDFMAALTTRNMNMPSGASRIGWQGIPAATAYLAFVFGGKQGASGDNMGDMVMWTSSSDRQFGGGLSDWLSPGQVAPLVKSGTLMPSTATSCVVPAEVIKAAPDFRVGTLTAFGPEENFAYPPRPADPKVAWKPEWTARVRHRSTTSWMTAAGMSMGGQEEGGSQQQQGNCKPKRGLGGMLGGALGGGNGC